MPMELLFVNSSKISKSNSIIDINIINGTEAAKVGLIDFCNNNNIFFPKVCLKYTVAHFEFRFGPSN